jgi:NAD(P)-dependent dehydrogenase (short-subunit alcohol dehydrogenase family)
MPVLSYRIKSVLVLNSILSAINDNRNVIIGEIRSSFVMEHNRVALITGASRGLGALLAEFLAAQGYDLVLTARSAEALEGSATALKRHRGTIALLPGDVTSPTHRSKLIQAARALGGLNVLINNASDLGLSPLPALADYPLDDMRKVFEVNVFAPLALIQETLPLLKARGGLVVNVSSDAAIGGYPGWGGYGASKAALDLLAKTLANELVDDKVSVVAVDPGDMRTDMHQAAYPGEDISDRPLPEVTLPFWAWLFGQEPMAVSGGRYQAQGEHWEAARETV